MSNEIYRRAMDELMHERRTPETAEAMVAEAFAGRLDDVQLAAWLTALHSFGEMTLDLLPAVRQVRERMIRLQTPDGPVIDTCGTGGDHSGTFNISTAAAFVVAGAGVTVVKHGNRSFSSKTGSADVLQALGVPIDTGVEWAQKCLNEIRFAFCFAPHFHPIMAQFAPLRKRLGIRTLFNLIGPLANPAEARYQLIGVCEHRLKGLLSMTLHAINSGTDRVAAVVRGGDDSKTETGPWIDEVSLSGATQVIFTSSKDHLEETWQPEDFGLERVMLGEIQADNSQESAGIIERVLMGDSGPAARITIANAAAALFVARQVPTLHDALAVAQESIRSGKAMNILNRLRV